MAARAARRTGASASQVRAAARATVWLPSPDWARHGARCAASKEPRLRQPHFWLCGASPRRVACAIGVRSARQRPIPTVACAAAGAPPVRLLALRARRALPSTAQTAPARRRRAACLSGGADARDAGRVWG
jgi:hypothetical protein